MINTFQQEFLSRILGFIAFERFAFQMVVTERGEGGDNHAARRSETILL